MKRLLSLCVMLVLLCSFVPLAPHVYADSSSIAEFKMEDATVEKTPVKSIEVSDISIIEYTDGYMNGDYYCYTYSPEFTVTMENGQVYEGSYGSVSIDGQWYSLSFAEQQPQDEGQWQAGQSYTVTAWLGGVSCSFDVSILQSPIEKLEIKQVDMPEKDVNYYGLLEDYDPDTQQYKPLLEYSMDSYPLQYTATLKDGSIIEGSGRDIMIDDEFYYFEISHNQSNEPWELGGSYTAAVTIFGKEYPFTVNIVDNPKKIISLEVDDTAVMENIWDYKVVAYSFEYAFYAPDYSVTLNDGTKLRSSNGYINIGGTNLKLYYPNVYPQQWKLGQSYDVTASIQGISDTFKAALVESGIEKVEFSDVTIIENSVGSYSYDLDGGSPYFTYEYYPDFTVTFKDGSVKTFSYPDGMGSDMLSYSIGLGVGGFTAYGHFPNCTDRQAQEHWQVGGTYLADVSFMGFTDTINVKVIESPVKSVQGCDSTFTMYEQNGYGYLDTRYTVTLNDGTVIKSEDNVGDEYVYIYGSYYPITVINNDFSSVPYPFEPGSSCQVLSTVSLCGREYDMTLTVELRNDTSAQAVQKLEIDDIKVIYDENGEYLNKINPVFTYVMEDGSRIPQYSYGALNISERALRQASAGWQVGDTYTFTGSINGLTDTFNVTVVENPAEDLAAAEAECVVLPYAGLYYDQNTGKFNSYDFRLSYIPDMDLQLKLKDGSTVSAFYSSNARGIVLYNNIYPCTVAINDGYYKYGKALSGKLEILDLGIAQDLAVTVLEGSDDNPGASSEAELISIEGANKDGDGYTVEATGSFTIRPEISAGASFKVYSDAALKNEISATVPVTVSDQVVYIVVTAQNGVNKSAAYKLTIKSRSGFEIEGAVFSSELGGYEVNIGDNQSSHTLKVNTKNAEYKIYADSAMEFEAGNTITLNQGETRVYIHVTYSDKTEATYPVIIWSKRSTVKYKDAGDIAGWAKGAVDALNESGYGLLVGDENSNFNPKASMTRYEIAVVAAKLMGADVSKFANVKLNFSDRIAGWAQNYVKAVYTLGIMSGNDNGGKITFDGQNPTQRQQFARIFMEVICTGGMGMSASEYYEQNKAAVDTAYGEYAFEDESTVQTWAKPYVKLMVISGFMSGSLNNGKYYIEGQKSIVRQEVAVILNNALLAE